MGGRYLGGELWDREGGVGRLMSSRERPTVVLGPSQLVAYQQRRCSRGMLSLEWPSRVVCSVVALKWSIIRGSL